MASPLGGNVETMPRAIWFTMVQLDMMFTGAGAWRGHDVKDSETSGSGANCHRSFPGVVYCFVMFCMLFQGFILVYWGITWYYGIGLKMRKKILQVIQVSWERAKDLEFTPPLQNSDLAWCPPTPVDLLRTAVDMRGSAGADMWRGDELACFPLGVWTLFEQLTRRWLQGGGLPAALLDARMILLPKEEKVVESRVTPDGCRPITILSAFWRVWDAVLDPSIQYGGGCDAAVASAAVLEDYVNSGFLGTLDFSKCFDCLRPVASSRLLVACGVPPSLGSLICLMWTHHRRWVSWNGHVGSRPMSCGLALPQGDPLGPLVAALWLSAGARFVRRAAGPSLRYLSIFMDDRTWTSTSAEGLLQVAECWAEWSQQIGLIENVAKAQFTGRTAAQRQSVALLSRQYREHVTFLGTVTCGHPRGPRDRELGRIQHCRHRMIALHSCRLHVDTFQRYARAFCVSMVAYGWFAKLPPLYISASLWHLVKRGEGTAFLGNTWLRAIVEGGNTHLDIVTASALFRVVASLRQKQLCLWHSKSGAPVAVLRKWLLSHGWAEISPWKWRLEGLSLNISLGSAASLAGNLHVLRQGWRWWCWQRFLMSARHEIRSASLDEVLIQEFLAVDWKLIRAVTCCVPEKRSVVLAAFVSNAWRAVGDPSTSRLCPWCNRVGTFDHLVWECARSPWLVDRPPKPASGLLWRLGWLTCKDDLYCLDYIARVLLSLWDMRHNRGNI